MAEQQLFPSVLNDLSKRLQAYLVSNDKKTLDEGSSLLMENAFNKWESVFADGTSAERIACEVATVSTDFFQIVHDFMASVLAVLPVTDENLSQAWVYAHGLLVGLSRHKVIVDLIMKNGFLRYHLDELRALRLAKPVNWVLKTLLLSDLSIMYNCAKSTSIHAYYHEFHFSTLLCPFLSASDNTMVIHAKLILAYVSSILTDEEIDENMALSPANCNELIGLLAEASSSNNKTAGGFTVCELIEGLKRLLICQKNVQLLATSNRLCLVFVTVLSCGSLKERMACCELLWGLMQSDKFRDKLRNSDFPFLEMLKGVDESEDQALYALALCVALDLESTFESDSSSLKLYLEGCYKFGRYNECAKICSKHVNKAAKGVGAFSNEAMNLLLARSLYHIYRRQAFNLEELKNSHKLQVGKKYSSLFQTCYDNARKVIDILISFLDSGLLDEESSKMLDIAMIDYSRETNRLNECSRCLMCRKKAKLCRSHVFPRTILEKFCSSMSRPGSKKNITSIRQGKLESAKTLTTFLYCFGCEAILNRGGEEAFSSHFLDTIYDKNDTSSPMSEHVIHYDSWLYNFCVGLMFRGIGQYFPHGYSNVDQVYEIFVQCRHYLLGEEATLPSIALVLNPTSVQPAEAKKAPGFINFALNYPLSETSSSLPLDGVVPITAERVYFFLIHFGIINVILFVEPSQKCYLPDSTTLHPGGGIFHVPEDEKRADDIPKGLWKFFEQTAVELEAEHVQMSLSRLKWQEDNVLIEPAEEKIELFGFMPSFDKDVKTFGGIVEPASIVTVEKTIDFLPAEFQINHRSYHTSVILPDGHKLILHYTFTSGDGNGESVFLAVGDDDPRRPYIMYHCYHSGLQMHAAFFVNSETFEAEEYLPDKNPKIRVGDVKQFAVFRAKISKILPQILLSKGISSLPALLRRIQIRRSPNYDRRCPNKEFCWYCKDRCDLCMSSAGFGFSKPVVGNKEGLYNFCSDACTIATGKVALQPTIDFWDPTQNPPASFSTTCALFNTHKELLYIFAEFATENGYQSHDVTLCTGDDSKPFVSAKIYVVCTYRRGVNQLLFEFLVSENLEYQGPVRLSDHHGDELPEEFKISACTTLEMIIKQTLGFKNISSVSTLLKLYEDKGKFNTSS